MNNNKKLWLTSGLGTSISFWTCFHAIKIVEINIKNSSNNTPLHRNNWHTCWCLACVHTKEHVVAKPLKETASTI
jgi:hypothetical protein